MLSSPATAMGSARSRALALGVGLVVHGVAFALASLPLMGAADLLFTYDFCLPNIESPGYASLVLAWLLVCLAVLVAAAALVARRRDVAAGARGTLIALVPYCCVTWGWLTVIVGASLGSDEPTIAGSAEGNALYAPMALFLHTNQLVVPLVFGWILRAHLYRARAAAGGGLATLPAPPAGGLEEDAPAKVAVDAARPRATPTVPGCCIV